MVSVRPWLRVPIALVAVVRQISSLKSDPLLTELVFSQIRSFLPPSTWLQKPFRQQKGPKSNQVMAKLCLNFPY